MFKFIIILLLFTSFSFGYCLESIIQKVDNTTLSSQYKKIAYYSYLLKIKREYIAKSYLLLADIRKEESKNITAFSSSLNSSASMPIIQAGTIESDILGVTNKYNLAFLNAILYQDIKKEIDDQFRIFK